jgi:hypothetical protein
MFLGPARRAKFGWHSAYQSRSLTLAYTRHDPADGKLDANHAPIIIMHGLFGSKQNNRGISK